MSPTYPTHPVVGVGAVVWKEDKVLLIQRGKEPRKGIWSIPGGKQELGETVREAVMREVKEETGCDVTVGPLIDTLDIIDPDSEGRFEHHYTLIDFRCDWVAGEPVAGSDAADVRWATLEECEEIVNWSETKRVIRESA